MRRLVMVGALIVMPCRFAWGEIAYLGGEGPPLSLGANMAAGAGAGGVIKITLGVRYREIAGDANAKWDVSVPSGLRLHKGSEGGRGTLRDITGDHVVAITASAVGAFTVVCRARAETPVRADDIELTLLVRVKAGESVLEHKQVTRAESVREGQRYRYGDWWLIPLDSNEVSVVESDIEKRGKRAVVLEESPGVCGQCEVGTAPDTVNWIVIVDSAGKLRDARVATRVAKRNDTATLEAAREALTRWRFAPAEARHAHVSDYLYVRVPVAARY